MGASGELCFFRRGSDESALKSLHSLVVEASHFLLPEMVLCGLHMSVLMGSGALWDQDKWGKGHGVWE